MLRLKKAQLEETSSGSERREAYSRAVIQLGGGRATLAMHSVLRPLIGSSRLSGTDHSVRGQRLYRGVCWSYSPPSPMEFGLIQSY